MAGAAMVIACLPAVAQLGGKPPALPGTKPPSLLGTTQPSLLGQTAAKPPADGYALLKAGKTDEAIDLQVGNAAFTTAHSVSLRTRSDGDVGIVTAYRRP